jgi:dTDP-4-amino-4,6-dideoxygalactose transaminase
MTQMVPQCSPKAAYSVCKTQIDAAINAVLESGRYILGRQVQAFEEEFAAYTGAACGVGVASGTDALEIALRACGVGPGDLVFTVSHTAVATVAAITRCGATPVFVDIDPATFTMDPDRLEQAVSTAEAGFLPAARPKAVIPVHLYGHPADMTSIMDIADRHELSVIEDCAQAHGAELGSHKVGTFGHLAAFSFYPTKNLGALGDAGIVVTGDKNRYDKLLALRQYGWRQRYISSSEGVNSRLDELQAAVLRVKLRYLDTDNARRRQIAAVYGRAIRNSDIIPPQEVSKALHVYHQYVVKSSQRDLLAIHLQEYGVSTAVHYPLPVHLQPAYRHIRTAKDWLPVTEKIYTQILSLPMYPQMTEPQIQQVVRALTAWQPQTVDDQLLHLVR